MTENHPNWNYHEFKMYFLLYAANSDFELQKEEKQKILVEDFNGEYQHVHKIFENHSDFERIETILSFREKYFPSEKETEKLIGEICELLKADEKFNLQERNFLGMMQKILRK